MKLLILAAADSIHSHRWVEFFARQGHEVHWVSFTKFNRPDSTSAYTHEIAPDRHTTFNNIDIIHRVYNISGDDENKVFNTKGDANGDVDIDPVVSRQIKGKVLFTLPKIGWIPIVIKAFVANLYGMFLNR